MDAHSVNDAPTAASATPMLVRLARPALALYWIALAVATHWPRLELGLAEPYALIQYDKIAHGLLFAGLTLLLMMARLAGARRSFLLSAAVGVLIASAYAAIDELTQPFFERTADYVDLLADLIGIFSVYLIATAGQVGGGLTRWRILLTRLLWLLLMPALLLLALTPQGDHVLSFIYRWLELSIHDADKQTHFALGMALTWLLAMAAPLGRRRPRAGTALVIVLMIVSAPAVELVQQRTGRGYELRDVWYHFMGLVTGLGLWTLLNLALTPLRVRRSDDLPDAAAAVEQQSRPRSFVHHALLVSALTLLSRITGLVRDAVLAAYLGLGVVTDAFFIGFLIPNLFRRLFGEGALTAAFVPHYTDMLKSDAAMARRFATLTTAVAAVVLALLTVAGEAALLALMQLDLSPKNLLAVRFAIIMLPYMPLICLVALLGGILQVHGRFGPPAAAPVILNVVMIGAAFWGAQSTVAGDDLHRLATILALSVLAAGALQLVWQVVALYRADAHFTRHVRGVSPAFRAMVLTMLPMLLGLAVFQVNSLMDSLIAYLLAPPEGDGPQQFVLWGMSAAYPIDTGAVGALQWAQRLYQFPLGVFGIAVATAIFPALAHAASQAGRAEGGASFDDILRQGLRLTMFIGLPASVGLILLRQPLTRLIFERGEFDPQATARVAAILAGYAAAVWAYSMTHVLTRAFYARKDATTPVKFSAAIVGLNLVLNLTLIWPLGAPGLAWSTAISAAVQVLCLLWAVRRHVAEPVTREVLISWARTAALTLVMAAALLPVLWYAEPTALSDTRNAALLALAVLAGLLIVLGGAWATGAPELHWLGRRRRGVS